MFVHYKRVQFVVHRWERWLCVIAQPRLSLNMWKGQGHFHFKKGFSIRKSLSQWETCKGHQDQPMCISKPGSLSIYWRIGGHMAFIIQTIASVIKGKLYVW